jgi:TonB-dependent Receptor Plug Domain
MRTIVRAALSCALALACLPGSVHAQQADGTTSKSAETKGQDEPEVMPPVTVVQTPRKPKRARVRRSAPNMSPVRREVVAVQPTAPETPAMSRASVLSQPAGVPAKLQHFQAESAETSDSANLLSQLPGTSVYSAGGVSGLPVIDGFAADRLHVEVAGMDLMAACANQMNPPMSYIAPPQVGSITVYSNIVPVSVGGDSIGGAILVSHGRPHSHQRDRASSRRRASAGITGATAMPSAEMSLPQRRRRISASATMGPTPNPRTIRRVEISSLPVLPSWACLE